MIGELEILVVLTRGLTLVIVATYTRLAQVVDARPYEIAYDIGMVYYPFPVAESVTGKRLRLHHHPVGHSFVVSLGLVYHIIIAHDVMGSRQRVIDFPIAVPRSQS